MPWWVRSPRVRCWEFRQSSNPIFTFLQPGQPIPVKVVEIDGVALRALMQVDKMLGLRIDAQRGNCRAGAPEIHPGGIGCCQSLKYPEIYLTWLYTFPAPSGAVF